MKESRYTNTIIVDKSKFVAIAMPLEDVDGFKDMLKDIQKEHPKAKHIVYAYKCGMKSKSCDDQEPKGTAGRPLLELIYKKNLDNIVIFVARYFGGIKLGASRLLRTYLQAGIEVLNKVEM